MALNGIVEGAKFQDHRYWTGYFGSMSCETRECLARSLSVSCGRRTHSGIHGDTIQYSGGAQTVNLTERQ